MATKSTTTKPATTEAAEPKPKPKKAGVFDTPAIIELANSGTVQTADELAAAMNLEMDGRLRRRLSWLATKDRLIPESFIPAKATKSKKAKADATPDLATALEQSLEAAKATRKAPAKSSRSTKTKALVEELGETPAQARASLADMS